MVVVGAFLNLSPTFLDLMTMAQPGETRIQLCGRFVVRLDGRRVEDVLPGDKDSCSSPTSCSTGSAGSTATSC